MRHEIVVPSFFNSLSDLRTRAETERDCDAVLSSELLCWLHFCGEFLADICAT